MACIQGFFTEPSTRRDRFRARFHPRRLGHAVVVDESDLPDRYRNPELIARGGMGEVYRAEDADLARIVAVKLLAGRFADNEAIRGRFTREALAVARLSHAPSTVTIFDVGEHDGRPYIVMEYLAGGSLADRLERDGAQPVGRVLEWLGQAAAALDAAHANGIVHRDVKPANLLLDDDERVKVADFGVASAADLGSFTEAGTVVGTAGYLAPEQARGERATPASDLYALAVVAFELLTGRRPFERESSTAEAMAHVSAPIPPASDSNPDAAARARRRPRSGPREGARASVRDRRRFRRRAARRSRPGGRDDTRRCDRPGPAGAQPKTHAAAPAAPRRRARRRRPRRSAPRPRRRRNGRHDGAAHRPEDRAADGAADRARDRHASGHDGRSDRHDRRDAARDHDRGRPPASASPSELNDQGFELMRAGRYEEALPLLTQAVAGLAGSGELAEAYASYNLAYTRRALGQCDGVVDLLNRSEQVQGKRKEISKLRKEAERSCER